jgi:hypothetical protein
MNVTYQILEIDSCHLEFGFHLSFELWHLTFAISYSRPFSFIRRIINSL